MQKMMQQFQGANGEMDFSSLGQGGGMPANMPKMPFKF
jgi:hypothetical protein